MSRENEQPPDGRPEIVARVRLIDALRAFGFNDRVRPKSERVGGVDPDLEDAANEGRPSPPRG